MLPGRLLFLTLKKPFCLGLFAGEIGPGVLWSLSRLCYKISGSIKSERDLWFLHFIYGKEKRLFLPTLFRPALEFCAKLIMLWSFILTFMLDIASSSPDMYTSLPIYYAESGLSHEKGATFYLYPWSPIIIDPFCLPDI